MTTCTLNVRGLVPSTANRTGYAEACGLNLRDRLYGVSMGRFAHSDRYEGSNSEPASLHRYVYTHGNPINGIDPSGESFAQVLTGIGIASLLLSIAVPAVGGVYLAYKKDVGVVDYLRELTRAKTWEEAAIVVGAGAAIGLGVNSALGQGIKAVGTKVAGVAFGVVSLAFSAWSMYQSIKAIDMLKSLSKDELAHALAVETATVILSSMLLQARRAAKDNNPLNEGEYTPKVIEQMNNKADAKHAFPALMDSMPGYRDAGVRIGGDGLPHTYVRMEGDRLKSDGSWEHGFYEWITDAAGRTNHRFFAAGTQ